jgi:hypothetical protein
MKISGYKKMKKIFMPSLTVKVLKAKYGKELLLNNPTEL